VVDSATGSVIRRLADSTDPVLASAACTMRGNDVLCTDGDAIVQLDGDLAVTSRLSLQTDLRLAAGGLVPSPPAGQPFAPLDGVLVYRGADRKPGATTRDLAVRLIF
jgi:hypothetical protein